MTFHMLHVLQNFFLRDQAQNVGLKLGLHVMMGMIYIEMHSYHKKVYKLGDIVIGVFQC
jgi:hypothetical protein